MDKLDEFGHLNKYHDSLEFHDHFTMGLTPDGRPCIIKKYKGETYTEIVYTGHQPIPAVYELLRAAYLRGVQDVSDVLKPLL